jgi:CRP/FNR family transcriptional regulator, cyclic AMP receptor protein
MANAQQRMAAAFNKSSEPYHRLEQELRKWALPNSLAEDVANRLTLVTYEQSAMIFLRGSSADFLSYLVNGFVKLYLPQRNGARTLLGIARPGDLLGFINSLDSESHRTQVLEAQALTKCSLALMSRDHLVKLLLALDPETIARLLEQINATWSAMLERCARLMGLPFRDRLQLVLEDLKLRVGVSERRGVFLVPELTHEDLAEMIGSSRPMVTKLIADMAQDGLLLRSDKQHYVLRSTGEQLYAGTRTLNEREIDARLCANGIGAR